MHKTVRNIVPGKGNQRKVIEALRRILFPVLLEDVRITPDEAVQSGTALKKILRDPVRIPPATVYREGGPAPAQLCLGEYTAPAPAEYLLASGYVFRTVVMDRERRFLAMPSEKNHFSSDIYRANKNIRALRPISITEDAVALNTSYTDNFYHWFVDLVGRMLLLPDWDDKVICADTRYPYQKETLALLGVAPERIFSLDDYTLYRFKTLSVVSYPRSCPDPHSYAALKEMARRVKPDARERSLPKRVYISRGDVSGRRSIVNEQELLPIFKKYGFRRMIFSNLSLEDQIRAARNADHLIFPHGAAGVNLVFSPPGIRFMEIMSPRALDASSVCVCQSLGVPYHLLLGEMPAGDSMQAPFSVEPQALLRALERLVA